MEWIEAALAFAVVMMLFSTAVTVIMEIAHKMLRIREKGLQRLVQSVYDDIVLPRLPRPDGDATTAGFVNTVTKSRFLQVRGGESRLKRLVSRTVNADKLTNLTTLEFVERLAETPAGKRLFHEWQRRGEDYLNTFLGDLASKFEDYSRSSSEYFARRARLTSTVIAIVLAFSLNVNAVQIYESLLRDESLRQSLIEQGEEVGKQMQEAEKRLAAELRKQGAGEISKEELDASIAELRQVLDSVDSSGMPIGWDNFPWKSQAAPGDEPDDAQKTSAGGIGAGLVASGAYVGWAFSVLLAGLLIGLGGPFWFDVFRKLGALAGMVRGMQTTVQKVKEKAGASHEDATEVITKVFKEAAKGQALANVGGRPLLTPDGRVDRGGSQ